MQLLGEGIQSSVEKRLLREAGLFLVLLASIMP